MNCILGISRQYGSFWTIRYLVKTPQPRVCYEHIDVCSCYHSYDEGFLRARDQIYRQPSEWAVDIVISELLHNQELPKDEQYQRCSLEDIKENLFAKKLISQIRGIIS